MPIVQLNHVRKVYDTKVAVDDLSFTIEPGTMFGLLGPNGSTFPKSAVSTRR